MTRQSDTDITALYERLSRDDDQQGDSNSILHQKAMLERFARDNHFRNIRHFTDDGYSGTNFNRPDWQRLIAMVDAGQISTVIVKDMSRIGRNYLEVGMYTDIKFPNTHEAIIDEETFARVQEIRKNKRRPTRTGKSNLFSGIARCADCGAKMYYCTSNNFEVRQDHFVCSTSRRRTTEACETHFIRAVVLEEGVLQNMRLVISCIAHHEDAFRRALGARKSDEAKKELASKKRTVQKSENRLAELDRLFKHIYEDMVNGRLSEARFQMLSDDYEKEQAELRERIELLNTEIERQEDQAENVDRFIRTAKKYLHLEKLTPTILNDMVNAVYVHAPDKSSGHRIQDVEISYNYIGILPAALLYDL